jgi:hypothetical protein
MVSAHKCFNIAAMSGCKQAARLRHEIAAELSESEIAATQRAARAPGLRGIKSAPTLFLDGAAKAVRQGCHRHRFLDGTMALPVGRKTTRARAGGEEQRDAAPRKDIRHRKDQLATQIDVENGHIDAFLAFGQLQGMLHAARRSDHLAPEILEHVLQQQAYHRLVLDHENAQALQVFTRGHVDPFFVCH